MNENPLKNPEKKDCIHCKFSYFTKADANYQTYLICEKTKTVCCNVCEKWDNPLLTFSIRPIRPSEVETINIKDIPNEVIESFNELIIKNFRKDKTIIYKEEIIRKILSKFDKDKTITRQKLLDSNWLNISNIEYLYQRYDWNVSYILGCDDWAFIFTRS